MAYELVILDSAIFKRPFSSGAGEFLKNNIVVMSQTFRDETRALSAALDSESEKVLKNNFLTIISMIKRRECRQISWGDAFDVYFKAIELARAGKKICVMTGDILLTDRLLTCSEPIDVYDLNRDKIIQYRPGVRSSDVFVDKMPLGAEKITGLSQGSVLKLDYITSIRLGAPKGHPGREGRVFEIEGVPDRVAKIYKRYPSPEKVRHLERLVHLGRTCNMPWCSFPTDILYRAGKAVGFVMRKIEFSPLADDSLYLGDDEDIRESRLGLKRSYTLNYCLMLLAQIKILNSFGLCISDYNDSNLSTFTQGQPVTLIDVDSFAETDYCGSTVTDNCFSRKYDPGNKEQLCELCDEGALKLVFRLISLGLPAFGDVGQPYVFSDSSADYWYRRRYFPNNVLDYLGEVFTARRQPSVSIAVRMLSLALDELNAHPEKDITVRQMCSEAAESSSDLPPFEVSDKSEGSRSRNGIAREQRRPVKEQKDDPSPGDPSNQKHRVGKWIALLALLAAGALFYYLLSSGAIRF